MDDGDREKCESELIGLWYTAEEIEKLCAEKAEPEEKDHPDSDKPPEKGRPSGRPLSEDLPEGL